MKFAFIDAEKATWPVAVLCDVLGRLAQRLLRVEAPPGSSEATSRTLQLVVEIRPPTDRQRQLRQPARAPRAACARAPRGRQAGRAADARAGASSPGEAALPPHDRLEARRIRSRRTCSRATSTRTRRTWPG